LLIWFFCVELDNSCFHNSDFFILIAICNLHRADLCVPDANYLRTLDSSIKRNTTVIKKLKTINDEQKDGLIEDLKSVNLSKFVSEAVSYICEAKLRSADIQPAVQVILHMQRAILVTVCQKKFCFSLAWFHLLLFIPPLDPHICAYCFIAVGPGAIQCEPDLCLCQACSCPQPLCLFLCWMPTILISAGA
jgi:hypothetical protein